MGPGAGRSSGGSAGSSAGGAACSPNGEPTVTAAAAGGQRPGQQHSASGLDGSLEKTSFTCRRGERRAGERKSRPAERPEEGLACTPHPGKIALGMAVEPCSVAWDQPNGRERVKRKDTYGASMESLNKLLLSQLNICIYYIHIYTHIYYIYTHTEHLMESLNKLLS